MHPLGHPGRCTHRRLCRSTTEQSLSPSCVVRHLGGRRRIPACSGRPCPTALTAQVGSVWSKMTAPAGIAVRDLFRREECSLRRPLPGPDDGDRAPPPAPLGGGVCSASAAKVSLGRGTERVTQALGGRWLSLVVAMVGLLIGVGIERGVGGGAAVTHSTSGLSRWRIRTQTPVDPHPRRLGRAIELARDVVVGLVGQDPELDGAALAFGQLGQGHRPGRRRGRPATSHPTVAAVGRIWSDQAFQRGPVRRPAAGPTRRGRSGRSRTATVRPSLRRDRRIARARARPGQRSRR